MCWLIVWLRVSLKRKRSLIPTSGAQQACCMTHQSRSCFWNPLWNSCCKRFFFVPKKFGPSFKSTLQIEGTLQAWDWKLDGLDIGKLPKWRSFRALPIRFALQHRQNSPELTFTSWLGDERRWFQLGKNAKNVQVEKIKRTGSLCLTKNDSHHRVTKLQQERHLSLHLFDQCT